MPDRKTDLGMEPDQATNNSLLRRDLAELQDEANDFGQFQRNIEAYRLAQRSGISVSDALAQIQATNLP